MNYLVYLKISLKIDIIGTGKTMSTARLDDDFWTDPKIEQLKPDEKLLFIWFFTNPYRNYSGLYKLPKPMISEQTGLSDTSINRGMDTLIDTKLISYDPIFKVVFVHSMLKRQLSKIEGQEKLSEKQIKGITNHLSTLHNCPLIQAFLDKYEYLGITFDITPIDTPIDTPIYTKSQSQSQYNINTLSTETTVDRSNGFKISNLAELWNEKAPPELARVNLPFKRPPKKLKPLTAMISLYPDKSWWEGLIDKTYQSSFLRGKNDRGWKANFDFIVINAAEIKDGKYIDQGNTQHPGKIKTPGIIPY